ncbi:MAG: sigma-70 family RNA polymerase sigma factor [Prevotella sp.]|nr:sigma-70 family RNA polymerase sigma factor [Prevotella sp.]
MAMDNFFTRIINTIKVGPEKFNLEYGRIYDELRPDFIGMMKSRYTKASTEVLEEAFQDAMHQLYVDVKSGRIERYEKSIRSYVFTVGRNKAIDQLRRLHPDRQVETPVEELDVYRNLSYEENPVEDAEKRGIVFRLVHSIGEPCSRVLTYFFYDVMPMREIAEAMGYKSSDVAKTTKKKCLEKVKVVAKSDFDIQNLI